MDGGSELKKKKKTVRFVDEKEDKDRKKKRLSEGNDDDVDDIIDLEESRLTSKYRKKQLKSEDSEDDQDEEDSASESDGIPVGSSRIEGEEYIEGNDYTPDGIKIIPFNMKEELEEGTIDGSGNYIANRDEFASYDKWLDGITKDETEKARIAMEKAEKMRTLRMLDNPTEKSLTINEVLLGILGLLKERETVAAAMRRLSSQSEVKKKWIPNWKAKSLEKKKLLQGISNTEAGNCMNAADLKTVKKDLNTLVTHINNLTIFGEHDALDMTYEQIVRKLRLADIIPDTWLPSDPLPNISLH